MVCIGDATLIDAQHEIAMDWRAAYKKWIDGKGCEELWQHRKKSRRSSNLKRGDAPSTQGTSNE
jgi:hypothetical protein